MCVCRAEVENDGTTLAVYFEELVLDSTNSSKLVLEQPYMSSKQRIEREKHIESTHVKPMCCTKKCTKKRDNPGGQADTDPTKLC